jgi:hypothetical protein
MPSSRRTEIYSWGRICHRRVACLRLLLLCWTASERSREGDTWRGDVGREHSPRCGFGSSLRSVPLHFLSRMFATPIIGGMWFFTLRQLAAAASWSGDSVILLRALLVQVAAPAPQTTWRLLTLCPDVAELLSVVALCAAALGPVRLHPDHSVAEGR